MRRLFLIIVSVLVAGGTLGLLMKQDTGYVLVSYGNITLETSIWVFACFILVLLFVLSWVKRILFASLRPGSSLAKLTGNMHQKRASRNTIRGLLELVGGNWSKAEKLLTKSANNVSYPLINHIAAAYAASEQDAHERSKTLLREAHRSSPEAEFAISFAQSQIQMRQGHFESALATLLRLHKIQPKHRQVLKMLVQAYSQLEDWQALLNLTPMLKKEGILNDENMLDLEKKAFNALLEHFKHKSLQGHSHDEILKTVESVWQKLDGLEDDESMRITYAKAMTQFGDETKSENFIRKCLNKLWSDQLVLVYGQINHKNAKKALQQAESWLGKHSDSAELLLTCGRLSQKQQLWGKARDYYQSSIDIQAKPEAISDLGRLLNALGDNEASQALFLASLNGQGKPQQALPLPTSHQH
ncbi:heme biosynthesis protein HemY [Marinomonas sp. SBI22]|uniref:heme biosynthesis HemY N-terminal domain-containing protein n=1 Tax=unclassified Marinomonas TaxID=196814 RepID=UPI0005FA81B7|nr:MULTISPECIES: heme biosynthesis HemY N-terminal domain-containing protein [unclassified Marinomonas]KJZ10504.1 heme biosynthesis protein HemY [Marinomonas sp. S3726]KZM38550.1 heme biosynthesis protein HemY [Marinomonas sp. SBI22]KZM41935.1 heme biosynthesis protein HemY [Marinomonas sp. SBI8L]